MQFKEIILEISHNCNLSCIMCGFGYKLNPPTSDKFMKKEIFYKLVDELAPQTKTLRLNGRGESCIHPDFIDMLLYVHNNHPSININLFSNMSFNNRKLLNVLKNCNVQLFISFDSNLKKTLEEIRCGANYDYIIENIALLKDYSIRPFICMTVQEKNISEIYDMGFFAFKHKCSIIYNTVRSDEKKYIQGFINKIENSVSKIKEDFSEIEQLYANNKDQLKCLIPNQMAGILISNNKFTKTHGFLNHCPALDSELCILYNGDVTPCNMFNPYVYGNIHKDSLEKILKSKECLSFKQTYKSCEYCMNCANLGV